MKDGIFTIEHIMPQTLTPQWKEELGENWQQIYDTYLHTFANLTLTGFNTSYSNHSFQEKRTDTQTAKETRLTVLKTRLSVCQTI